MGLSDFEKKYKASNGIKITYIEDPYGIQNDLGKEKLVVLFSSLGNEKSEDLNTRFPYTLLSGLRFYNCRKIYLKDNIGDVGCYHLGLNGNFDVQEAIVEFLSKKIKRYKIKPENIIFLGNSKGGYTSLLFGHLLNVGNIIAGVPQFKLYNYIRDNKPFLKYILPEEINPQVKRKYNSYLGKIISQSTYHPDIYMITSKNDKTYLTDAIPLTEKIKKHNSRLYVYENNNDFVKQYNQVIPNSMNEVFAILSMLLANKDMNDYFDSKKD